VAKRANYLGDEAFAARARSEGYAARSVYKLQELDKRFRLLRPGQRVLDLGAAPGSWSQFVLRRIGKTGLLVSIDRKPVSASLSGAIVVSGDAFELDVEALDELSDGRVPPFDLILSDMAPDTSGVALADHVASVELCDRALELARRTLARGGALVVKVFQGEDEPALRSRIKACFKAIKAVRPQATRSQSVEIFLVATGFGGAG
jgi:23S rRNA (uridine2552-2'-O)-methyltransferase